MLSISLLLSALLSIATAEFYCQTNLPCLCTATFVTPKEYHIRCSADKSISHGISAAMQLSKYVNEECHNAPDWTYFLPDSKLGLARIEHLIFSGCELSNGTYFEMVMDQLFGDWRLKKLKCRISREFLDAFPTLKTLALSNNYLGKVDSDLLYGQRNLTKLNLRSTQIHLPQAFFAKSRLLAHLDLSDNGLPDLEPGLFDGLENLRSLNLSHNDFEFLLPGVFRGLPSLGYLDLSHSGIYLLSDALFYDTLNLTFVNLSGNRLYDVSWAQFSFGLDKLKYVKVTRNKLSMIKLPSTVFTDLPSLSVVSLEGLGLLSLSEGLFWGSVNILEMNLSENQLEALPRDLLRDARELRKFNASSNKLRAIAGGFFASAKKLMKLDLSKNRLTVLDRRFSEGLHALLELNLEDNELQIIQTDAFDMLYSLKVAKFSRNRLNLSSDFPEKMSRFSPCGRLEELDLSHNQIAKIFVDWLDHRKLCKLDLSYNNFSRIGAKDLQFISMYSMTKPLSIDFSHNEITSVNVPLSHLQSHSRNLTINLNDNPVVDCHCDLYALRHYAASSSAFKHVKVQTNSVACSRSTGSRDHETLECLSSLCASEGICDCWIASANRTLAIDCSRRNLTEAPAWVGSWDNLTVSLDLSGNALTRVPEMTSNGYDRVSSLNLADNRLASIDCGDLVSPTLRDLHLERNELTSISMLRMLNLQKSVQSVWLGDNPWLCDDSTSEFRRSVYFWYEVGAVKDYDKVACINSREPFWPKRKRKADLFQRVFDRLIVRISMRMLGVSFFLLIFTRAFVYFMSFFKRSRPREL